jgi:hypothetical protein
MRKAIPTKQDSQIKARTIGYFVETGMKAGLDSATQTALLQFDEVAHDNAKLTLNEQFGVEHVDRAIAALLQFHKAVVEKMDGAAKPGGDARFSSAKLHRFYSLVYHMLDEPDEKFLQHRNDIAKALVALKLPAPLSKKELAPHVAEIITTSSPSFERARQR